MSSLVLAPVDAAKVLPVCLRSWNLRPEMPTSAHVGCQTRRLKLLRRSGVPSGDVKTWLEDSTPTNVARWDSSSGTTCGGSAISRRPAAVFGGPSISLTALKLHELPLDSNRCGAQIDVEALRILQPHRTEVPPRWRAAPSLGSEARLRRQCACTCAIEMTGRSAASLDPAPRRTHGLRARTSSSTAVARIDRSSRYALAAVEALTPCSVASPACHARIFIGVSLSEATCRARAVRGAAGGTDTTRSSWVSA